MFYVTPVSLKHYGKTRERFCFMSNDKKYQKQPGLQVEKPIKHENYE